MSESVNESKQDGETIASGPEIVAAFVRKISTDESMDRETVTAIESLHRAGKLTAPNLLRALESARTKAKHGSLTKA